MHRTTLLLALGLLAAACGRKAYDSTLDRVRDRGVLVVGTEPEFPPFESLDEHGEYVGFDMDLAGEIAKELEVELEIRPMGFDALPAALETGRIDLILSGMTATEERARSRSFTAPYYHTGLCLLVGADSGIERPADANGKRLVVKLGTTGDINAPRLFPDAEVTRLDTEGACALEVVHGRADAFLYDRHSVARHHQANPERTRALLEPLTEEPYAMAVRLGDQRFVDWLDDLLRRVREDGRYDRIYRKHFGDLPDASR